MALVLSQFTGLLVLSPVFALATALVLALVAVVATWITTRLFQQEVILTSAQRYSYAVLSFDWLRRKGMNLLLCTLRL